jgi:mono/diheme cytochrome c family protein
VTLLLTACGGGQNAGDINPASPPEAAVVGPDSFLLFPNPQLQPDGTLQTNTVAYANAYYAAIDPLNERDTLAKWKAKNLFDTGTGTQVQVVFGDARDLGYGRRMTARKNADGTIAFFVENYLVQLGAGYGYSPLNLNAAIARDTRWLVGINAIEFSPGPAGGVGFAKFYNFNGTTGARQTSVDLDGRGPKAMPGPCITCHGGRGDALTPPDATGNQHFNLVQNAASAIVGNPLAQQNRGDVQAHLQAFSVDTFDFSATPGFTRADQEAALKQMNQWVLCSYPLQAASALPEDACRRLAVASEWVGTAADVLKNAYGGNGLPNATFSDTYVPTSWAAAGQTSLYQNVVVPACRTCHQLRGTRDQASAASEIDFATYAKFQSYAERIKHHVQDFGNMPLAKIVYDAFYASGGPDQLATFLTAQGQTARDGAGAVLKPGRPVTRLVDRVITQGPTTLTAPSTRFATSYAWSVVSGPNGAVPPTNVTLTNSTSAQPTFNASANGTYVVRLVVASGAAQSAPVTANIEVNNSLFPAPANIRFSDIKAVLAGCAALCHNTTGSPLPPVSYDAADDRDRDGTPGTATDDLWFYTEVKGRVNLTDPDASALLRKPSGMHHQGGLQTNFDSSLPAGAAGRANYDLFLNWISNNAPQ